MPVHDRVWLGKYLRPHPIIPTITMASNPDPPPVPHINNPSVSDTPAPDESPDSGYFAILGRRTLTPLASPAPAIVCPTTPISLLRAAPLVPPSPSHAQPRIDTQGEASTGSPLSSTRITRTTSPSDNRSTTLSPSLSSGGGSLYSSDALHSPCSLSSSEYLTPPQFQPDSDKRPYKARRQSSESLSMMRKAKIAKTMSQNRTHKSRRRRRRTHKCYHGKGREHEYNAHHWSLPGCLVAPTALKEMKDLCEGHVGRYRPIESTRGNTDTFGRVWPRLRSDPAPPTVSRRWSSVEIGSHQIHFVRCIPPHARVSSPGKSILDSECISHRLSRQYRSTTFTGGAIDSDIVSTVRDRLTAHEVPLSHVQPPATITLRRASETRGTGISITAEVLTQDSLSETPRPYPRSQADRKVDTAYLITKKEIDSITELIEASLRRNCRPHNSTSAHAPPASNFKDSVPRTPSPAESTHTITPARHSHSRTQDNLDCLQVKSTPQTLSRRLSQTVSQSSTHDIIWQAEASLNNRRESSRCMSSSDEGECERPSASNYSSPQETPSVTPRQPKIKPRESPTLGDKSRAFDPNNAQISINELSWRLPPAEIPLIVTSSDSESNELTAVPTKVKSRAPLRSTVSAPEVPKSSAKGKARGSVRQVLSSPEIEDVVSFPPLPPRKTTNDWYSPLPDIISSVPKSPAVRSLYDAGIDATGVLPTIPQASKPEKLSFLPLSGSPSPLGSPRLEPNLDYDRRRKSLIKAHPHTPARVGSQSAMGSSIGASSGERRSSAKTAFQRVKTIDNVHKGERTGTWTRNRPPSVCPPPKTPSPTELEDESDMSIYTVRSARMGSALEDRSLLKSLKPEKGSPLPKTDKVGIYDKITGTVKSALGLKADDCEDECTPKHDCDDCAMDPRNPSIDWIG